MEIEENKENKEGSHGSFGGPKPAEKKDFVEIPVGKVFNIDKMRGNPWILATVVLGAILFFVVISSGGGGGGITGNVVSENVVSDNLLEFINAQGQGEASLTSVERDGELYNVVVNFDGQDVPVFVTLDGEYLVTDRVPIASGGVVGSGSGAGTGAVGDVGELEIGDAPFKGDADAPVVLVEFSDYQCPFCGKFYSETLSQIDENYIKTGKVKLVYMDYPLPNHPEAQGAAVAARCAREQGGDEAYFEMHDRLFEEQGLLSEDNYKAWARELGLDGGEFDVCLDSGKFDESIAADLAYGSSLGVQGTPGFFVNGKQLRGAQPYSVFEQVIEAELAAAG